MDIKNLSTAFTTNIVEETKLFYQRHFNAKITFDCGWYVNLELGKASNLQFMAPQKPEHKIGQGPGLIYNIAVENIDKAYEKLSSEGLEVIIPLEDHPWGDLGFGVQDPNGITLYIYTEIEPTEEFKKFYIKNA
jgi:uncharacterized glyoxalase superfamily protein PhnB